MFKRTAVPPVGPSDHQARQPLNMALGFNMKRLVVPAMKAALVSVAMTLSMGAVLAGISSLFGRIPGSLCNGAVEVICDVARVWVSYWWLAFTLLFVPLTIGFFGLVIRKFAKKGDRLASSGLVLVLLGGTSLLVGVVSGIMHNSEEDILFILLRALFDAGILLIGLVWIRPRGVEA
jgi:hypothetical protein